MSAIASPLPAIAAQPNGFVQGSGLYDLDTGRFAVAAQPAVGVSHLSAVFGLNELCAELHNRMPAVLQPAAWSLWLGEEPAEPAELKALLKPFPSEETTCWPVSPRVGNVRNNDASLIEPIAA